MTISSFIFGNYKTLGRMLTDGVTAVNAVLIGDSTSDDSYYPNYREAITRWWDVNLASVYHIGRAVGTYGTGGYQTYIQNSGRQTSTNIAPGDSFGAGVTYGGAWDFPAACCQQVNGSLTSNDVTGDATEIYDGYIGGSGTALFMQPTWKRRYWLADALTIKALYLRHAQAPTNVVLRAGRTLSDQVTALDMSTAAGTAGLVSASGTIAAAAMSSSTWPKIDWRCGLNTAWSLKTLVHCGAVMALTTPGTAPFRLTNVSTSGFRTVDHIATDDASGLVPAGAKANGKYTTANLKTFLGETLDPGAYAGGVMTNPPNLFIIHLGLNSYTGTAPDFAAGVFTSAFTDYLDAIIQRYRAMAISLGAINPQFLLFTPWANNGTGSTDTKADSSQSRILALASRYADVTVFDVFGYIKSLMNLAEFDLQYLRSADHLHMNGTGVNWLGQVTWNMVLESQRLADASARKTRNSRR